MNWREVNKSWKEFSKLNNSELKLTEKSFFQVIKCEYRLRVESSKSDINFYGVLWKSSEGYNRNYSKISSKISCSVLTKNIVLKNNLISNFFFTKKLNDFEKSIVKELKLLNGKKISIKKGLVEIELNQIISSEDEFIKVMELIVSLSD